jgi:hypothetical protein
MHDRPEGVTPSLFQEPGSKGDHAFGHQASDSRLRNEPPKKLILKNLQVSSAEQRGEKGK